MPQRDYQFPWQHTDDVVDCLSERGFAVAQGVLDDAFVARLRSSIAATLNPDDDLEAGQSRFNLKFVEHSEAMLALLDHQPFMQVSEAIYGTSELTVHRSAAI